MNLQRKIFTLFLSLTTVCPALRAQFAPIQFIHSDTLAYDHTTWYVLDWDGDGHRDILFVASQPSGIYYLKNDGAGQFSRATLILNEGSDFVPGDINGDGTLDLVLFGPAGCDCIVWRPNLGGGVLGDPVPVTYINFGVVIAIQKVVDWDGDGDLDVVMVDRWIENAGLGLFNDEHPFSGAATYFGYAVGDLNSDGRQDVLSAPLQRADPAPLQWIRQLPNGAFTDLIDLGTLPAQVEQLILTDLDADTDPDILLFSYTSSGLLCSWYANDGTGAFGPNIVLPTPGDLVIEYGLKPEPADLNGDGLPEIIFTVFDTLTQVRALAWFHNPGSGQVVLKTAPYTGADLLVADITGDGKNDIVENNGAFLLRENKGGDVFLDEKSIYAHDADLSEIQIMDMDNDGDLDLSFLSALTRNVGWRPNDGAGHFGGPRVIGRVLDTYFSIVKTATKHTDLNGDGLTDLTVYAGDRGYVWLGTGNGQFAAPDTFPMSFDPPRDLALADADDDGDLDLVFAFSQMEELLPPDSITWYANDGTGKFGPVITDIPPSYDDAGACNGDLDGNGENDLLFHLLDDYGFSGFSGSFYWCPNLGGGVYGPKQLIYQYKHFSLYLPQPCARDMDGDGDLDVSTEFGWFENSGHAQTWKPRGVANTGLVNSAYLPEDFDNDSDTDIFFVQNTGFSPASSNAVFLFKNDGEGRFFDSDWSDFSLKWDYLDTHAADLDNDNDLDILFSAKNTLGWWENVSGAPPVSAKCFLDNNGNGQQDSTETPLPGVALRVTPGELVAFTNEYGIARFYVDTGDYEITYLPGDCRVLSTDSATYSVHSPFPGPARPFGFKPDSARVGIGAYLAAATPTRCGFAVPFQVSLRNTGCIAQPASFSLRLGPLAGFLDAYPWPNLVQGDSLVWHTTDTLLPGEIRPIQLLLQMPGPDQIGKTLHLRGRSWPSAAPGKAELSEFKSVVNCAYDPNDKLVNYAMVPPNYNPETWELAYTVRFQNTGTDTAFHVTVRDHLDPLLDWSTFRPIASSHSMRPSLQLADGKAVFQFDNIQLPDSNVNEALSHGFVQFAVRLKNGLPAGTLVQNQAGIYFDFNPPVLTNVAETRIQTLSATSVQGGEFGVSASPNPTSGLFSIELPGPAEADMVLRVFDLGGRLVLEKPADPGSRRQTVQAGGLPAGLYQFRITDGKGRRFTGKIAIVD